MVVPRVNDPSSIGWDLVGLGAVGGVLVVRGLVAGVRSRHRTLSVQRLFLLLTSLRNSWDLLVSVGAAIQIAARS